MYTHRAFVRRSSMRGPNGASFAACVYLRLAIMHQESIVKMWDVMVLFTGLSGCAYVHPGPLVHGCAAVSSGPATATHNTLG